VFIALISAVAGGGHVHSVTVYNEC
jgi:hypothetical protein